MSRPVGIFDLGLLPSGFSNLLLGLVGLEPLIQGFVIDKLIFSDNDGFSLVGYHSLYSHGHLRLPCHLTCDLIGSDTTMIGEPSVVAGSGTREHWILVLVVNWASLI